MNTALLLIDIQNDYFPGGAMELDEAEKAGKNGGMILAAAREHQIPVIHVQHLSLRPGSTFFLPDTPGSEIHHFVEPVPGEQIIQKHFPNCFRDTDLEEILHRKNIQNLIVAGMMTHMCVDTTVRAAADLNYQCILASDATATRDLIWDGRIIRAQDVQGGYLAALSGLFANVLPTKQIIEKILSLKGGTKPENRQINGTPHILYLKLTILDS